MKKKVWDEVKKSDSGNTEDLWDCIKKGLVIYFSLYQSKDNYRLFKDNIPSEVREEMIKENKELQNFINTYSRR